MRTAPTAVILAAAPAGGNKPGARQRASALEPVHAGGTEVGEVVLRPQLAVAGEAVTVVGPGGGPRAAPGLVGDAGQAGQQQKGQVVEAGDGLGPDRGLDPRDLGCPAGPERLGRLPAERLGDGPGRIEPQA